MFRLFQLFLLHHQEQDLPFRKKRDLTTIRKMEDEKENLKRLCRLEDENILREELRKVPLVSLINFFIASFETQRWIKEHALFVRETVSYLGQRGALSGLDFGSIQLLCKAIHSQAEIALLHIDHECELSAAGTRFFVPRLLLMGASPYLFDLVKQADGPIEAKKVSAKEFKEVVTYILKGTVPGLWRDEKNDLFDLLSFSDSWELDGLSILCQETLKRYIDKQSVIYIIIRSLHGRWLKLLAYCKQFVEEQDYDASIALQGALFSFSFQAFTAHSLSLFQSLKKNVLKIRFSGDLVKSPHFNEILSEKTDLVALDLSEAIIPEDFVDAIPPKILEISLEGAEGLIAKHLFSLAKRCVHLREINLSNLPTIDEEMIQALSSFPYLIHIQAKGLTSLNNDLFRALYLACSRCTAFNFSDLPQIQGAALVSFFKTCKHARDVSLNGSNIEEEALLDALGFAKNLQKLSLCRCPYLSSSLRPVLMEVCPSLQRVIFEGSNEHLS